MSINEQIRGALLPMGYPVKPDVYTGTEDTYFTFNYNCIPADFADDVPSHEIYLIQVHFVCPLKLNTVELRQLIKTSLAISGLGFATCTPVYGDVNVAGEERQHIVFETTVVKDWNNG